MSELILIRHGQADAFSADSDRLTELGERQAALLGDYLVARGERFDRVVSGAMRRHRQTEAQVAQAFRGAGQSWPEPEVDADWNEYDAHGVLGSLAPVLAERDPAFARAADEFRAHAAAADRNRYFQRMLERVMEAWISGAVAHASVESFAQFHGRVLAARERVQAGPSGQRVIVFSSGGPVGVMVQSVLDAPKAAAMQVNWRVKNASATVFTYARDRISLDSFNGLSHLPDPAHQTFR
jgi:broad specificity phosphatase PhoE